MQESDLLQMGKQAKEATYLMARASTHEKNLALKHIAGSLETHRSKILRANDQDLQAGKEAGLSEAMLDRSSLQNRLQGIASDVSKVIDLPDPIGEFFERTMLPNGLDISKCRTPIGVLGVIYEARPNVTIDIAALTIKTGNCAILRGGTETLRSNRELVQIIQASLKAANLPSHAIQFIDDPDRGLVQALLRMHDYIDLIIPRGGANLHRFCREQSTIPVITGGIGICHLFVDETADVEGSLAVIHNAKTQRPTVCNSLDTLLVHSKIAPAFIPRVIDHLSKSDVHFRLDKKSWELISKNNGKIHDKIAMARPEDWDTEWLSLILGVKIVSGLDEAISHIHQHSTGHSDGILTNDNAHAERFIHEIDSAAVYVNASTRFTDGGQLGLGAEVAISTQKLHARGPMGLKELTSYKWVIRGKNHIRP